MVYLRFARGAAAAERGIDGRVDPLLEGPGAGFFGVPDVDVAELAVGLADTQVRQ